MTIQMLLLLFGALLLLIAVVGGGFEIRELKLPQVELGSRIASGLAGLVLILIGLGWSSDLGPVPEPDPPSGSPVAAVTTTAAREEATGSDWAGRARAACQDVDAALPAAVVEGDPASTLRQLADALRALDVRLRALEAPSGDRERILLMTSLWDQAADELERAATALAAGDALAATEALVRFEAPNARGNQIAYDLGVAGCADLGATSLGGTLLTAPADTVATRLDGLRHGTTLADATAYVDFVQVMDDTGSIVVEIPAAWADIDPRPLSDGRPSLWASPDLAAWQGSWSVPGVRIEAHPYMDPRALLDLYGWDGTCESLAIDHYDDGAYQGAYQLWDGCGSTEAAVLTIAAAPEGAAFSVAVSVQLATAADWSAAEHIVETFVVAPSGIVSS